MTTASIPHSRCELAGAAFFADPYSTYARLRAIGEPVIDPASGAWLVSRYTEVEALLRDARCSKNYQRSTPTPFEQSVLFRDPPDHSRVRGVLNRAFSGNAVRDLDHRIHAIADRLIDRMTGGEIDFISAFALPLPVAIIAELLGVPLADVQQMQAWSNEFIPGDSASGGNTQRRQHDAISAMAQYFERLIAGRPSELREDVLGVLMQAHASGELSRDELIGNCILLIVAGHETTVNSLGNGLYLLLRHPDQLALLRRRPELWTSALEEIVRYESPVQLGTFRITTEPVVIACRLLEAGSLVNALIGSANRDPEQFPEPDRFDIQRAPNRHLAFGSGPHRCPGASLARTESRIGLTRLFERLPNLQLARAAPKWGTKRLGKWLRRPGAELPSARWKESAITRGLAQLRVSTGRNLRSS